MAAEQLSGTIVVIIIAIGVQVCIMLFIFAKRQIQRFTLRNRRGPHFHLGQGAPKPLRRECDRYLEYVPHIRHEPKIISNLAHPSPSGQQQGHFFRSKAMQLFTMLEREITCYSLNYVRLPGANVRSFLLDCANGPLLGIDTHEIHIVCDEYEHARHHYSDFGEEQLQSFTNRLNLLHNALASNKAHKPHPSPMPRGGSLNQTTPTKRRGRHKKLPGRNNAGSNSEEQSIALVQRQHRPRPANTLVTDNSVLQSVNTVSV